MKPKTTTYTFHGKYGIDDLKPEYAYRGNSQGDESTSSDVASKNNPWMSFILNCEETQSAINIQISENKLWNQSYVEELKKSGKYGRKYPINAMIVNNPLFDEVPTSKPLMSSNIFFFNANEEN